MTIDRDQRLNEIWAGDKLDRRELAEQVESYIKARFEQPAPGSGSFTFAVEGSYGLGKSYFLERLKKQLSLSHPVAFVNAWTDDTANDPLTSIFLAIEEAIAEKLPTTNEEERKKVADKVKGVAKIAAKVALRGAGSFLFTEKGSNELVSAFETGVDDLFGLKTEKKTETALVSKRKLIADFQSKLNELLTSLETDGYFTRPLIIIVDELDRCRPTYAISLLEEAKHFFDDTGTIFVYGMNRKALAATVKSIYGDEFPADHYLMRFVRRQVCLPETSLHDFVSDQWVRNRHLTEKFLFPDQDGCNDPSQTVPWLAALFAANSIRARDAEYVLELLFSFAATWDKNTIIHLPYVAYLAVAHYRQERGDQTGYRLDSAPEPFPGFLGSNEAGVNLALRYQQIQDLTLNQLFIERQRRSFSEPLLSSVILEVKEEYKEFGNNAELLGQKKSLLPSYKDRLKSVGAFIKPPEPDDDANS
jgi:KAP family P-loop domain